MCTITCSQPMWLAPVAPVVAAAGTRRSPQRDAAHSLAPVVAAAGAEPVAR